MAGRPSYGCDRAALRPGTRLRRDARAERSGAAGRRDPGARGGALPRVARVAVEYGAAADPPIPYLADLLRYEEAMMVVEAGPRQWRDSDGAGGAGSGERYPPEKVEGTLLLEFAFDLPTVLPKLLQPWTEVPPAPVRPTKLLVARSPQGRVAVARSDAAVAAVVQLADGKRTLAELAAGAGLQASELEETLKGLVDLGALRFSTGS